MYAKPLDKPNFQQQTTNQAMNGNKISQTNDMTGKLLSFFYCSRSNSSDNWDTSGQRSPNRTFAQNSKPYYKKCILKHHAGPIHHN